ncbi:MAG: hypothetical protein U0736_03690 [Gemmataceae bacterium]
MSRSPVVQPRVSPSSMDRAGDQAGGWWHAVPGAGVTLLIVGAAVACSVRGTGDPLTWFLLALSPFVLRSVISVENRRQLIGRVADRWRELEQFARFPGPIPWIAAALFAGVPALLLFLFDDRTIGAGDTAPVIPTAVSLVREGNWDLNEYFGAAARQRELPYYVARRPSGIYSTYPAGMVVFAAPVAAAAHLVGADFRSEIVYVRLEKWTAAWVAAGCLTLFFLLAVQRTNPEAALMTTALLGTGSVLYSTVGQALWQHGGVIFWTLLILVLECRPKHAPADGLAMLVQAVAAACMVACRLSSALILMPVGIWVLLRAPRRGIVTIGLAALAYAPWAWLYHDVYGTPFGPSTTQLGALAWTTAWWVPLAGILVSPARGLLVYQPWLLLGLVVYLSRLRRSLPAVDPEREPWGWTGLLLTVVVLHLGLVASWRCWWGGHCWGSRLLAEVVPLLALLCVRPIGLLWQTLGGRRAVVWTAALAFLLHFSAVHYYANNWNTTHDVDRDPAKLWDWKDAPFLNVTFQ